MKLKVSLPHSQQLALCLILRHIQKTSKSGGLCDISNMLPSNSKQLVATRPNPKMEDTPSAITD